MQAQIALGRGCKQPSPFKRQGDQLVHDAFDHHLLACKADLHMLDRAVGPMEQISVEQAGQVGG